MKRILILSYDFDGCLFHNRGNIRAQNFIINENKLVLDESQKKINAKKYDQILLMVGSNRQSHVIDIKNAKRTPFGSCFKALIDLNNYFNSINPEKMIDINPYLLSDTYGNCEHGENFTKAVQLDPDYQFKNWFFDISKITLLYAQMHEAASLHPDDKFTLSFFEDLYFEDDDPDNLLGNLHHFFACHRDLTPNNVTLNLNFYNGGDYKDLGKIRGEGPIDFHYEESIKSMITCAGFDYEKGYYDYNNVLKGLQVPENLAKFKMLRETNSRLKHSSVTYPVKPLEKDDTEKEKEHPTIYLK